MNENQRWAEEQFGGAALSDIRRTRRAIRLATRMLEQPGATLPQLGQTRYDVKATYTFFAHPAATPEGLQAGHRTQVREQLRTPGPTYLLVEDTTVCSWSGQLPIVGLGPIGNGGKGLQGFLLHSVLALQWASEPPEEEPKRPPVQILGLADQQYHVRCKAPGAERALPEGSRAFARQQRWRESALWRQSTQHLGPAPEGVCWVRICDRGADVYEFLQECQAAGHSYVVRAAQDRALLEGERLFARVREAPACAQLRLHLRRRGRQRARVARLNIAVVPVVLRAPRRPGAPPGSGTPLSCTALRVWEADAPRASKPGRKRARLEWILLTDRPIETPEQAKECVQQYATRWVIEEFHKVLKSGLGAERLQLEHARRLFAALALMSIVALRLLHLKEWLRVDPEAPAHEAGLDPLELHLLELQTRRSLRSVREVALALGRLGGHLGRKGDGLPGWITLWRGLQQLQSMALGAQLIQGKSFGE
jgi:hypothetical protein